MKKFRIIIALLLVSIFTSIMLALPSNAADIADYQSSVVCIGATIKFTASNFNLSFTSSATGTGFAVGKPGENVQYIATCAHVVHEPSGIFTVAFEKESKRIVSFSAEPEGTFIPNSYESVIDGVTYTFICDYFTTSVTDLYALFSNSSNDYIAMTVTKVDPAVDLALCKLASSPTNKISALPLQLKNKVEKNTDILAIGYPSTSRVLNAENRLDASDSTVKDGIISRINSTPSRSASSQETFDAYEVTAELITGMSGGPVISEESGAIIGVTSFGVVDVSQAAAARYAICIDYLIPMLDAEGIEYVFAGSNFQISLPILIIILAAVLLIAVIVIVIVLLKKKSAPVVVDSKEFSAAPSPMKFHLNGISGYHAGKRFGITGNVVIGRDNTKCNVVFPLNEPGVSGVHCELQISGNQLILKDCNSSYGTYLENGTKLEPNVPVVLLSGSKFFVGSSNNIFNVEY